MSLIGKEIVDMVEMLPEQEQKLAYEVVKRMVLAWDSDFTKLTAAERERLNRSLLDFEKGEATSHNAIDWN